MRQRIAALLVLSIATAAASGCATYADRTRAAWQAIDRGDFAQAVAAMNAALGVDSDDALPESWKGDRPLAALERGMLLQAMGRHAESARTLQAAEAQLELLDLRIDAIGALAEYLYSGSARVYKTPPTERLALNPINLLNYLAQGDLEGAAVEARRFQVMRDYLDSIEVSAPRPAALGAYFAGFTFDRRGEADRALRYYEEALATGPLRSLRGPVARLAAFAPYRGPHLEALLHTIGPHERSAQASPRMPAEVLIVVARGRVPHREPKRMPLGLAIGYAGAFVSGDLSILEHTVAKVVVYPELVETPSRLGDAQVTLDGRPVELDLVADLAAAVREEYEAVKPRLVAAALTRLLARAAIAEGMRRAGREQSSGLGALLGLLTEGALVALDRPDTRSWSLLPGRVLAARLRVPPGEHRVRVGFSGAPGARELRLEVPPEGFAAAVVTDPR